MIQDGRNEVSADLSRWGQKLNTKKAKALSQSYRSLPRDTVTWAEQRTFKPLSGIVVHKKSISIIQVAKICRGELNMWIGCRDLPYR